MAFYEGPSAINKAAYNIGKEKLGKLRQDARKAGKDKLLKLKEGAPTDLYKVNVEGLSQEELFAGKIKYIPYTRSPQVHGIPQNTSGAVSATMLEVFDSHDAIDLSTQAQLRAVFIAFDIYSDASFCNALLHHSFYAGLSQWMKDWYYILFATSQFFWLLAAFLIAGIIGKKIIRAPTEGRQVMLFLKLWFSIAVNAPLVKLLQIVSYGTMHFQVSEQYGAMFVGINTMRTAKAEGGIGFLPQTITLVFEDIGLLILNVFISEEVGYTWESVWAMFTGVVSCVIKTYQTFRYCSLGTTTEDEMKRQRMQVADADDVEMPEPVGHSASQHENVQEDVHDEHGQEDRWQSQDQWWQSQDAWQGQDDWQTHEQDDWAETSAYDEVLAARERAREAAREPGASRPAEGGTAAYKERRRDRQAQEAAAQKEREESERAPPSVSPLPAPKPAKSKARGADLVFSDSDSDPPAPARKSGSGRGHGGRVPASPDTSRSSDQPPQAHGRGRGAVKPKSSSAEDAKGRGKAREPSGDRRRAGKGKTGPSAF